MTDQPWWLAEQPSVLLRWGARAETVESVAERLRISLRGIDGILGSPSPWQVSGEGTQASSALTLDSSLDDFIASTVYRDDFGAANPRAGYRFALTTGSPTLRAKITVVAGDAYPERAKPSNQVLLRPFNASVGQFEALLELLVTAWDAPAASIFDGEITTLATGRGRWAPPIGFYTWIGTSLGTVVQGPAGVMARAESTGVLLRADDALDHAGVVDMMKRTLAENQIAEIPRNASPA